MKRVFAILFLFLSFFSAALAQPGSYDTTFGKNKGFVHGDFALNTSGSTCALAVQPDTFVIIAGFYNAVTAARYKPNGQPDSLFGKNGKVQFASGSSYPSLIHAVAIQPDGKILLAGQYDSIKIGMNAITCIYLVRLNKNGSFDTSFGQKGSVKILNGLAVGMALQKDGKIVTTGAYINNFVTARFLADGNLDTLFGNKGVIRTNFNTSSASAFSVKVQRDKKIVVAGGSGTSVAYPRNRFAVIRYDSTGKIDSSFGINGCAMTAIDTVSGAANSMDIQSDGKIVLGGRSDNANGIDFALIRYKIDGSPDSSFGTNGIVVTDHCFHDFGRSLLIQPDNKIVLAGFSATATFRDSIVYPYVFTIARYDSIGTLDTSFGGKGVFSPIVGRHTFGYAIALQPDGKIVFGGTCFGCFPDTNSTTTRYTLLRIISGLVIKVGPIDTNGNDTTTNIPISQANAFNTLIYPNPIKSKINIEYQLLKKENIDMYIMDLQGRILQVFFSKQERNAGSHTEELLIDERLSTGNYYLLIKAGVNVKSVIITKL